MKLKPYAKEATCPKCFTRVEWRLAAAFGDRILNTTYCDGMQCRMLTPNWRRQHTSLEHLHCTCPNCGFGWLMECADAQANAEDVDECYPEDEGCTCGASIGSPAHFHMFACPVYQRVP